MNRGGGMQPGIIILREGTDTSQVRSSWLYSVTYFAALLDLLYSEHVRTLLYTNNLSIPTLVPLRPVSF